MYLEGTLGESCTLYECLSSLWRFNNRVTLKFSRSSLKLYIGTTLQNGIVAHGELLTENIFSEYTISATNEESIDFKLDSFRLSEILRRYTPHKVALELIFNGDKPYLFFNNNELRYFIDAQILNQGQAQSTEQEPSLPVPNIRFFLPNICKISFFDRISGPTPYRIVSANYFGKLIFYERFGGSSVMVCFSNCTEISFNNLDELFLLYNSGKERCRPEDFCSVRIRLSGFITLLSLPLFSRVNVICGISRDNALSVSTYIRAQERGFVGSLHFYFPHSSD